MVYVVIESLCVNITRANNTKLMGGGGNWEKMGEGLICGEIVLRADRSPSPHNNHTITHKIGSRITIELNTWKRIFGKYYWETLFFFHSFLVPIKSKVSYSAIFMVFKRKEFNRNYVNIFVWQLWQYMKNTRPK